MDLKLPNFYTNVQSFGSRILYRGIKDGKKIRQKIDYHPTLYVPAKKPTKFTTIYGEYVEEVLPGNIRDAKDFVKQYEDVGGFTIYGNNRFEYAFISDNHPDDVDWDISHVNITNIDIEVGSENGFPDPSNAAEPITAITLKNNQGKFIVFGCDVYVNNRDDIKYVKCSDEIDLIKRFIEEWSLDYPDIITGWNVKFFDVPYLYNRINKMLGEDWAKRLSPWNFVDTRTAFIMGRDQKSYILVGISILDYIELYRRYAPGGNSQESYKLDAICHVELGERKLSYAEYGNLHTLYKENYQLFIDYNIKDVELVEKLDDKLKLIELALTLAYDSKTNYEDTFAQVRMWDALIYNHLRKNNMVIPPNVKHQKDAAYVGAFVKDPILGMHKWVASFDLNSLYPHLIMQWNISPETLLEPEKYDDTIRSILSHNISVDSLLDKDVDLSGLNDYTLAPNGQFFSTKKQGFLPEMMEAMYNDRSAYKKKAISAKKELELETDPDKRYEIEKKIARYNNLQLAKKVSLNSAYGALGNEFFRFFDIRQASAITTSGQLVIRWIEKDMNQYMNKLLKTEDQDYVIASDTDSIYLTLDRLINETIVKQNPTVDTKRIIKFMDTICENKIQPFIDSSYNNLAEYLNVFEQKMQMKREALADKGIWTAKKRYILNVYNNEGVEYAKPKMKIMGLEAVKSSTPAACREKIKEALDIIISKTEDDVINFIEDFREEFKKLPEEEIAFPRGVNGLTKERREGVGVPIHVRGSLVYNTHLKNFKLTKKYPLIKEGEKIKFIYLKEPNSIHSNIISFPSVIPSEFNIHQFIDYDTQFDKSFVEPLKIILDSVGWKTEHVASLDAFFV